MKTPFGWTLFGSSRTVNQDSSQEVDTSIAHLQVARPAPNHRISAMVKELWKETPQLDDSAHVNCLSTTPADDGLQQLVEKFWVSEHTYILRDRDISHSVDDQVLLEKLERKTYQDIKMRTDIMLSPCSGMIV